MRSFPIMSSIKSTIHDKITSYVQPSQSLINIFWQILEVQGFSCDLSIQFKDIFCLVFKVRGSIECVRNEQAISSFSSRDISIWNRYEFFLDFAYQLKSSFNLLLRIVSLNSSTDNCDIVSLFRNWMNWRNHHDIDVYIRLELPFFLLICLWGKMIWTEGRLSVPGIGWSKMQIHLMILSTSLTLSLRPHLKA